MVQPLGNDAGGELARTGLHRLRRSGGDKHQKRCGGYGKAKHLRPFDAIGDKNLNADVNMTILMATPA
ncbi:hypothetical protein D3C72_2324110 [compost metagenome]